ANTKPVGLYRDRIARGAVNFHILAGEGPVPRALDDGFRVGVRKDDGRVVIHPRIDLGFVLVENRTHSERGLPMHQPGHQVDAVAAEVIEGAGTVLGGIGEPVEEFRTDADFFWALVAVVDNDTANGAKAAVFRFVVGGAVAGVPSGLVVDQDLNVVFAGDAADGEGVVERDGEGLLHHDGEAVFAGGFNDLAMIGDGGVGQKGLR